MTTQELLQKANAAKRSMALADSKTKNQALLFRKGWRILGKC